MRVPGGPAGSHLTYCTNVHAGESWTEVRANLERYVVPVRNRVAPDRRFGVGLKEGLSLPNGLSSAHYIGLLIDRAVLPYSRIVNFDSLPIPFRCMATDFLKAEPVELRSGSLGSALRATMAIPGVFTPVSLGDWLLVDGGVVNNVPGDVVRGELRRAFRE